MSTDPQGSRADREEIPLDEMDVEAATEAAGNVVAMPRRSANGQLDRSVESLPFNQVVEQATAEYLEGLDLAHVPSPATIERELLHATNAAITLENLQRDKADRFSVLKVLTNHQVADILLRVHHIVRIGTTGKNTDPDLDLVAMYCDHGPNEGIYLANDDVFLGKAMAYNYSLGIADMREVMNIVRNRATRVRLCDDRDLVCVGNGVFNTATKQLAPFSPGRVFLSKSPIDFVADPELVTIHNHDDGTDWDVEGWMRSLSPDDPQVTELLWQLIGACIRPRVRWNKSAWLYSERGNNGKGTLCSLIRNVVGESACASIPIVDFAKDFALEQLLGASAIVNDENDVGVFIDKAANMKAVITNDVITINRKFKAPIAYQFFGFMVQCINEKPKVKDRSESFYRRQLFIPMVANFTGRERRYIKDDYLRRREVLEYVLHRVLMMGYYVLDEPEATRKLLEDYKVENDPVRSFWAEFSGEFCWSLLPYAFLYDLYRSWFARNSPSGKPLGKTQFIRDLRDVLSQDGNWVEHDNEHKVRIKGLMDGPEPLISDYELKDWMNPATSSSDRLARSMPLLRPKYAGFQWVGGDRPGPDEDD